MVSTTLKITTARGDSNIVGLIADMEKAAQPTVGDCLYAGQRQRTRMLNRTARGVDVNETAFAPYSTRGPYYYYPSKNAKNRRAGVTRISRKIGLASKPTAKQKSAGILGRTRLGIKFASYSAFKSAFGRFFVDLRGISAPHMLQAMIIRVKGIIVLGGEILSDFESSLEPATEIFIGIYGDEAGRAEGHNLGTNHLPQRRFIGANDSDKREVLNDILRRSAARVRKIAGGDK